MPDPAATFNLSNRTTAVTAAMTASSSSLYILHKDWTKPILRPYSIQSIIDGDQTNNQYSVVLRVPTEASHMFLYWVTQAVLSDTGASVTSLTAKIGTGAMTVLAFRLFGRFPREETKYLYGPFEAGLANAVAINDAYGYWRAIGNIQCTVNSTLEITNQGTAATCDHINYRVSTTRRLVVAPIVAKGLTPTIVYQPINIPVSAASAANTVTSIFDSMSGGIPLKGCSHVMLVPEYFGTLESTTIAGTVTAGTISSFDFTAIGATFNS